MAGQRPRPGRLMATDHGAIESMRAAARSASSRPGVPPTAAWNRTNWHTD
jgi:hypothetical protein